MRSESASSGSGVISALMQVSGQQSPPSKLQSSVFTQYLGSPKQKPSPNTGDSMLRKSKRSSQVSNALQSGNGSGSMQSLGDVEPVDEVTLPFGHGCGIIAPDSSTKKFCGAEI